jgi:hypothetical protein
VYAIELFCQALFAILVGSATIYLMLLIGFFVLPLIARDTRSEAELQAILNKNFRPSGSGSNHTEQ